MLTDRTGRLAHVMWMLLGMLGWTAVPAAALPQGQTCGIGSQDCCVAGQDPGCKDEGCCTLVCANDAFCCATQWDEICAKQAQSSCASCVCGSDDCCSPHVSTGCNDPSCCDAVCAVDPFCCNAEWDGGCVLLARQSCGAVCPFDCALPAHNATEAEQCLQDLNGTCGNSSNQVIQVGTSIKGCTWAFAPVRTGTVLINIGAPTLFQAAQHGLENGDRVTFSTDGELPTGLVAGEGYFVRNAATNSFQVAATLDGAPIATSGTQTGTHRFQYVGAAQRDIDRYRLTLATPTLLTLRVFSESLCFAEVLQSGDCANVLMTTRRDPILGECPSSGQVCLAAGSYEILVAPGAFTGVPFPPIPGSASNEYVLQLAGVPCEAGPPPNDFCTNATAIDIDPNMDPKFVDIDFSNRFATTDAVGATCGTANEPFTKDLYWSITPEVAGDYLISTCNDGLKSLNFFDTGLEVWSGCPQSSGVLVACNDDGAQCNYQIPEDGGLQFASSLYVNLESDVEYFIRVGGWAGAVGEATLHVEYVGSRPTCSDAGAPACCTEGPSNNPPFCAEAVCCELTCGVDAFCCAISWDAVCVEFATRFCTICGGGSLGASDTCAGALVPGAPSLTVGSSLLIRTSDASTEYQLPSCDGSISVNKDVYLPFTAPRTGSFVFDTCAGASVSIVDTVIEAWSGCPGAGGTLIACNDETAQVGCIPLRSRLSVNLTAGQLVLIRVGSADSTAGDFTIRASEGPAGVSCANPEELVLGSSVFSRADSVEDIDLGTGCVLSGSPTNTLWNVAWFEYVATRNGPCTVSTCNPATNHDTNLAVFASCTPGAVIACNDDACGSVASEVTFDVVCGQRFLIAIGGSSPSTSLGSGIVTVSQSGAGCPPPVVGDLTGDGVVNGADLGIVLTSWGSNGPGDINGDGIVDGADLGLILTNWTP